MGAGNKEEGGLGKLRARGLPKVDATAGLRALVSRWEHWPAVARSTGFIKSIRLYGFTHEMSSFLKHRGPTKYSCSS